MPLRKLVECDRCEVSADYDADDHPGFRRVGSLEEVDLAGIQEAPFLCDRCHAALCEAFDNFMGALNPTPQTDLETCPRCHKPQPLDLGGELVLCKACVDEETKPRHMTGEGG